MPVLGDSAQMPLSCVEVLPFKGLTAGPVVVFVNFNELHDVTDSLGLSGIVTKPPKAFAEPTLTL
jgi:hypothetical protein